MQNMRVHPKPKVSRRRRRWVISSTRLYMFTDVSHLACSAGHLLIEKASLLRDTSDLTYLHFCLGTNLSILGHQADTTRAAGSE